MNKIFIILHNLTTILSFEYYSMFNNSNIQYSFLMDQFSNHFIIFNILKEIK